MVRERKKIFSRRYRETERKPIVLDGVWSTLLAAGARDAAASISL